MKKIITDNLNDHFNSIRKQGAVINRNPSGATIGKTAIIDKTSLPNNIQRKMASASGIDVKMGSPSFYHPLFQSTNMMLPRDRRERNEWCRHFYRTEPIVATSLDLHTEFPISDFNHVCPDKSIKEFFDYMSFDRLDIIQLLLDIGLEYWKIGDAFPFGQLNENEGIWDSFTLLNPDYINISSSVFAGDSTIELIPDAQVKTVVQSGPRGEYKDIYKQLPDEVIKCVKAGKNIKLDNRLVSHISHKASQYEAWGTPILNRCFKTLIYKDRLRQAQDSIATRHITPLRVAKIGSPGEPMPSQDDINSFRDTLLDADQDPNYFIVYHYGLSFDYVGSSGKILPLNQEFDFIQKELMNGLGINQAMLNGEGPTYANAQVGFNTLARRYMSYRLRLENWIKHKVYKPIAEVQGFYKPNLKELNGGYRVANRKDRQLIIPDIRWDQYDLTSNQSIMNFIQNLQSKGLVSMSTVLPIIGLDPNTEKKQLEEERGTVFDPNAPKTGPLPNSGTVGEPTGKGGGPLPAGPKQDNKNAPTPPTPPPSPTPNNESPEPEKKTETSLELDDFFTLSGDSQNKVENRMVTKIVSSNIPQQKLDVEK